MNKLTLTKYITTGAMALSILPFMASAHGMDNENKGEKSEYKSFFGERFDRDEQNEHKAFTGTVTALSTTGFTLKDANGTVYTVTTANAKLVKPFLGSIVLADIKVNDKAVVKGSLTGTTIAARSVQVMPANTHPAMTKGTITAVNGNTITVQNTHLGVVSNVTIKTDANTQVTKDGQAATLADASVGATVKIKGLWDETLNVLNAIRINIKTMFSN